MFHLFATDDSIPLFMLGGLNLEEDKGTNFWLELRSTAMFYGATKTTRKEVYAISQRLPKGRLRDTEKTAMVTVGIAVDEVERQRTGG